MKTIELLIKEEIKQLMLESIGDGVKNELSKLIQNIKNRKGIDPSVKENDGEILAMILIPILQSIILDLDPKSIQSYRKRVKGRI